MTKRDICERVAERAGLTRTDTMVVIDMFLETIKSSMEQGHDIEFRNFGSFRVKLSRARQARNPMNGDVIMIPERKMPRFKPALAFKFLVNK